MADGGSGKHTCTHPCLLVPTNLLSSGKGFGHGVSLADSGFIGVSSQLPDAALSRSRDD